MCAFDHDMHMNTLEAHWLFVTDDSHSTTNVQYISISSCTQLMGIYCIYICSTPVVVVMQYAHYGVYSVPQSECVGWYKWTPANTAAHNLRKGMYLSLLSTKA